MARKMLLTQLMEDRAAVLGELALVAPGPAHLVKAMMAA